MRSLLIGQGAWPSKRLGHRTGVSISPDHMVLSNVQDLRQGVQSYRRGTAEDLLHMLEEVASLGEECRPIGEHLRLGPAAKLDDRLGPFMPTNAAYRLSSENSQPGSKDIVGKPLRDHTVHGP